MRLENGHTRGKEGAVLPCHICVFPQTSAGDIWAAHTRNYLGAELRGPVLKVGEWCWFYNANLLNGWEEALEILSFTYKFFTGANSG